jgi:hypothetical protein
MHNFVTYGIFLGINGYLTWYCQRESGSSHGCLVALMDVWWIGGSPDLAYQWSASGV